MKNTLKLLSLWLALFVLTPITFGWSYPVLEVEWNFCWADAWICKIDLPRIEWADYLKYKNSALYREIYSVMYWATYFDWRDFWNWSHQGVDISSTLWTLITSAGDWVVITAEERWDWGKTIVIKHTIGNTNLYTIYAHLDEILVTVWQEVKEKEIIAKMGKSGNATWIHVHFQIDTNEWKHPYFPNWCNDTNDLSEKVNEWKCRNKIKENTVDPILFLETNWAIFEAEHKIQTTEKDSTFITPYQVKYELENSVIKLGKYWILKLAPKTANTDAFLDEEINFMVNWDGVKFSPEKISYIGNWREVTILTEKTWLYKYTIMAGIKTIKKWYIFVLDDDMIATLREKTKWNKAVENILDNL